MKKVLVTGGSGFLGSYVIAELERREFDEIIAPPSSEYDLRDGSASREMLARHQPELVIHLAATVGGIGANRENPGRFFYENLMMGVQLIHECWRAGVAKLVTVGTVCAYPKHTPVPFREDDLWSGYPEETNAPYGVAKKALLVQGQAYRDQYDMRAIYLLPANLYGPRDNFDPRSSHVIPALIRKCVEAREAGAETVEVWGDGTPTREFLHARDAARGIVAAAERYDAPEPVNLGTGVEISIRALVEAITRATGFDGEIVWLTEMPNGQPRRCLDVSRARERFGFEAEIDFETGLAETVEWWLANRS
jgi:GDP-L-fucose synthase